MKGDGTNLIIPPLISPNHYSGFRPVKIPPNCIVIIPRLRGHGLVKVKAIIKVIFTFIRVLLPQIFPDSLFTLVDLLLRLPQGGATNGNGHQMFGIVQSIIQSNQPSERVAEKMQGLHPECLPQSLQVIRVPGKTIVILRLCQRTGTLPPEVIINHPAKRGDTAKMGMKIPVVHARPTVNHHQRLPFSLLFHKKLNLSGVHEPTMHPRIITKNICHPLHNHTTFWGGPEGGRGEAKSPRSIRTHPHPEGNARPPIDL